MLLRFDRIACGRRPGDCPGNHHGKALPSLEVPLGRVDRGLAVQVSNIVSMRRIPAPPSTRPRLPLIGNGEFIEAHIAIAWIIDVRGDRGRSVGWVEGPATNRLSAVSNSARLVAQFPRRDGLSRARASSVVRLRNGSRVECVGLDNVRAAQETPVDLLYDVGLR